MKRDVSPKLNFNYIKNKGIYCKILILQKNQKEIIYINQNNNINNHQKEIIQILEYLKQKQIIKKNNHFNYNMIMECYQIIKEVFFHHFKIFQDKKEELHQKQIELKN